MRRLPAFVLASVLAGCFPDGRALSPEEHLEATRLRMAYEEAFDATLDDRQLDCLHSVEIEVSTESRDRWCDAYACYWISAFIPRRQGIMFFPDDLTTMLEPSHGQLLRHELLHRLLHCAEDDADPSHSHAAWAGAPYVPAPSTSIVASAGTIDPKDEMLSAKTTGTSATDCASFEPALVLAGDVFEVDDAGAAETDPVAHDAR